MAKLFMVRTPGSKDFPGLSHLIEGRVFDNVAKADAERLIDAGIAEEFDTDNELHVQSVEEFDHLDARRGIPVVKSAAPAMSKTGPAGYDEMTVEDLHKEAAARNLEGRGSLTTKADLTKALEKDDKTKGKK